MELWAWPRWKAPVWFLVRLYLSRKQFSVKYTKSVGRGTSLLPLLGTLESTLLQENVLVTGRTPIAFQVLALIGLKT